MNILCGLSLAPRLQIHHVIDQWIECCLNREVPEEHSFGKPAGKGKGYKRFLFIAIVDVRSLVLFDGKCFYHVCLSCCYDCLLLFLDLVSAILDLYSTTYQGEMLAIFWTSSSYY